MNLFNTISYYILIGVCFNALYDFIISKLENESLRLNMRERIAVTLIWPVYITLLIFNYIKNRNKDE